MGEANRHRTGWILLLAGGLLLSAFIPMRITNNAALWIALSNASHFPLFLLIGILVFLGLARFGMRPFGRYVSTLLICLVTAVAIELLQPLLLRTASWTDLINGTLGLVSAILGIFVWRRFGMPTRLLHLALSLAVFAVLLRPAWIEWRSIDWRTRNFPLLANFEDPDERRLWHAQGDVRFAPTTIDFSGDWASSGDAALVVRGGGGRWVGVRYHAGDIDWSGFQVLAWEMHNPGEPFKLTVRIDDARSNDSRNRFRRNFSIETGRNEIRIPIGEIRSGPKDRSLEMSTIRRLILHLGKDSSPRVFYLDSVRLE